MEVTLLNYTPEPDKTVAAAARLCYSAKRPEGIWEGLGDQNSKELIEKLIEMGHESPMEHITFTFAISGVSRTLSHQLVRHRIASFSQKSQRYVSETNFTYVIPPSIARNPKARERYEGMMEALQRCYKELREEVDKEDARYILPNATTTQLICTFNARSLFNFFKLRCCNRAQWEIRALSQQMLLEVKGVAPAVFANMGATCDIDGSCPEGSKSCGRYKVLVEGP